ncbi:uncharacterized protein LOC144509812 [Mustelus asterias]
MESDHNENNEPSSPNLMPRHRALIPTPCGPMKHWSDLSCLEKMFVSVVIVSLIAVTVVTIESIVNQVKTDSIGQTKEDFTISIIQLFGIVFCFYYVVRGTFQENRQELIAFILSISLVVIRSVVNFSSATPQERDELAIRFAFILVLGVFLMVISVVHLLKSPSMMAFRVSGALESAQFQYFIVNLCFSMVTFDLQAQLCLCVLVLTSGMYHVSLVHSIILGVGIVWAILKAAIGLIAILKGKIFLVWIFLAQNLPEVAYLVYLLRLVIIEWGLNGTYVLEAGAVTGAFISVTIKIGLVWSMVKVSRCFGQDLHERMFSSTDTLP